MSSPARAEEMPMPALVPNVTPGGAAACNACPRAACFQVRVEGSPGHACRRENACASHLVDVIDLLRAWARDRRLAGGWLTVLAIDPYALPRLAALGIPEPGFAFYSAPITATPVTAALLPGLSAASAMTSDFADSGCRAAAGDCCQQPSRHPKGNVACLPHPPSRRADGESCGSPERSRPRRW
jgi:hypothetical protein